MGLDDRFRAKMEGLLRESSDSTLTAHEKKALRPDQSHTPVQRQPSTARLGASMTRCWACSTALRDPGAAFFACGACGASNGAEPATDGEKACLWRPHL